MAPSVPERLVNLMICLMSASEERRARHYVTREYIVKNVEGYQGKNPETLRTMFERDKTALRRLGIVIEQGPAGAPADKQGYYLARGSVEMPTIDFTPEEQSVLGVAARVWSDEAKSEQTATALAKLRTLGVEVNPEPLAMFTSRVESREVGFDVFSEGVAGRRRVQFEYHGKKRVLEPWVLIHRMRSWYVTGWEVVSREPRQFKLSRIEGTPRLMASKCTVPVPEGVVEMARVSVPCEASVDVVLAIKDGRAPELTRRATPVDTPVLAGYTAYRRSCETGQFGVAEICSYGADVLVVAPASFRQAVIDHLNGAANV